MPSHVLFAACTARKVKKYVTNSAQIHDLSNNGRDVVVGNVKVGDEVDTGNSSCRNSPSNPKLAAHPSSALTSGSSWRRGRSSGGA